MSLSPCCLTSLEKLGPFYHILTFFRELPLEEIIAWRTELLAGSQLLSVDGSHLLFSLDPPGLEAIYFCKAWAAPVLLG